MKALAIWPFKGASKVKHMATLEMSTIVLAFAGACVGVKGLALHETWELLPPSQKGRYEIHTD